MVIFDELLTNVVTHGYEGAVSEGHIEAALSLEGNRLIMEFIDECFYISIHIRKFSNVIDTKCLSMNILRLILAEVLRKVKSPR